jgi:hypothetical protein
MESEEINKALQRYVVAVLRARGCSDDLAAEQAKASHGNSPPPADIAEIPDREDGTRSP